MNFQNLTGSAAVGAAIVILWTHGKDFSVEEIAVLSAGVGAVISYVTAIIGKFLPPKQGEEDVE